MSTNPFQPASRAQLKARVALDGPSGAGKTWTALEWATVLAEGAPIAVVDTEHGSASLYSDRFQFDVLTWDGGYDPGRLADVVRGAADHGYGALIIDSLSHFWEGEGGTLDIADAAGARAGGNSFAGWKTATPQLRRLVDTILGARLHVIVTMRTKTEFVLEEDSRGKKIPRRVGMAPVMRQGIEYEFTLIGEMDLEHRIVISKSRCDVLADVVVQPGAAADAARTFADWLGEGEPLADGAVVDALVARLNALPERERKDSKREFVEIFGAPGSLPESKVEAAARFVDNAEVVAAANAAPAQPVGFDDDFEDDLVAAG